MSVKYVILLLIIFSMNIVNSNSQRGAFDQDLYENVLDPVNCNKQLELLYNNILGLKFLDASGKLPSGIETGNLVDLGDYHHCLGINVLINDTDIQGKYCMVKVPLRQNPVQAPVLPEIPEMPWPSPDNETIDDIEEFSRRQRIVRAVTGLEDRADGATAASLSLSLAVCIPKVCTAREAIDFIIERLYILNLTYSESYCRLRNDKPFSSADYVASVIFSVIALITIISTSYDLHHTFVLKKEPSQASRLGTSFSVYTNTRSFLTFDSHPGTLDCVDGIRSISMIWVIVGHTYATTMTGNVHNTRDISSWSQKFTSVWIMGAPITVDTFFLLSGILCVYSTIGKGTRSRFIRNIHVFYRHRFLRMFPLLATIVLLQASFVNHLSDGPQWNTVASSVQTCREKWWSALLHVQNYVKPRPICVPQSWYLSVDMQLYIVCPVVLVWLFGRPRYAWFALTFAVLLSLISSSVYSFLYDLPAGFNFNRFAQILEYMEKYYYNTLTRAPPFFVGMVYGYILHLWRGRKIRIQTSRNIFLWLLAFALTSFCVFSVYPVLQQDHDDQTFDNFLNAYMRFIWALGLGWMIVACAHGYGGPINWFLSLPIWKLLARLSYAMYLVHFSIMMVASGSWIKTHYFTDGDNIYRFMSDIMLTFWASLLLCIVIDTPASTLEKLLFSGGKKTPGKSNAESQENIVAD